MHSPCQGHFEAIYRILRYLKKTPGRGLFFGKEENRRVEIFIDADWAGYVKDRKSTSGYCTRLWGNLVTWRSKKQFVVARSSAEAEYRAMAHGMCEAIWLKRLLEELKISCEFPMQLYCDNKATISIAHSLVHHDRTKHVEVDKHFITEKLEKGIISIEYIPASQQVANILTKGLPGPTLEYFVGKLRLIDIYSLRGSPSSLFTSVRCGLELAILNSLATRHGLDLLSLLHVQDDEEGIAEAPPKVKICGLVDSDGTPTEVADVVAALVKEGFAAIKLKVARRGSPTHDAEVIQEVRKKIGDQIELRVDANRNWTYEEAIQFGSLVKDCDLQYIEEPVKDEGDIIKFFEESGLPVALDETIDCIQENPLNILMKYTHPGIVAIVIKPSVVGGFESAALIAQWAQQHEKMAVISSTFESGLGLSAYIHLSCYLEQKNAEICKLMSNKMGPSVAHGLGTYQWLKEDVATTPLKISCNPYSGIVEASVADANRLLQSFQINRMIIHGDYTGEEVRRYRLPVDFNGISYYINVQEIGQISHDNVLVFLHGFLGTGEDWIAITKAASRGARCISIDLPGHGSSRILNHDDENAILESSLSIEVVAEVVRKLIHEITPEKVTVIGYSMGARIALFMALRFPDKVNGAVVISGSPGLKDEVARKIRRAVDDSRARFLVSYGLDRFLDSWYAGQLWNSLREHPKFNQIVGSRLHHHEDVPSLAKVLSDSSTGRQQPLWDDLKHSKTPLLIIVGGKDEKFKRIAQDMSYEIHGYRENENGPPSDIYEMVEIPNCGHAVHLENPLPVVGALRRFLTRLNQTRVALQTRML
ncbi:hypothetical protein L484_026522 [Morus notabilis]|uniref:Mandelate racemase/muconate lactonizing enzyme C-terminal domain-containing protein n=1 Tax=Morus notabilis TaxID=981085 RepID=W9QZ33_9ROSA|nr:hypothetical protein L484_026522 [Morus notabilis]